MICDSEGLIHVRPHGIVDGPMDVLTANVEELRPSETCGLFLASPVKRAFAVV